MSNFKLIRPAISLFVVLSAITGLAYPLLITSVAQTSMPIQANGSLITKSGSAGQKVIGSALIGQSFTQAYYLWGRPSATAEHPYNGMASGGSNLGPLNPELAKLINERVDVLQKANPDSSSNPTSNSINTAQGKTPIDVPIDLVTASASGLDPDVSPAAAAYQASRIAKARQISIIQVQHIIDQQTKGDRLGIIGARHVNVLAVNLALDRLYPITPKVDTTAAIVSAS